MVGKIKRLRFKLHQASAKLDNFAAPTGSLLLSTSEKSPVLNVNITPTLQDNKSAKQTLAEDFFHTRIFASTKITPEVLIQSLKYEERSNAPISSKKGSEERPGKTKKEKMKERRKRWLKKISSIKQTKEQQVAKARRQATPLVGDLRPLVDALPELCPLNSPSTAVCHKSTKNKIQVIKPEPTDFSQMNKAQKHKLLETESSSFTEAVKIFSTKNNPLAEISEHLRKRIRQEDP
ncbi:hypothetical protein Q5P01_005411 [Channa striata]|uniref:Protein FAM207A n=1 Tax=Channa striata TaxID=64152 RepID=A0AA88T317_CHASR|nr:hypothetical protein Q5P01_005411 [Channa striata]